VAMVPPQIRAITRAARLMEPGAWLLTPGSVLPLGGSALTSIVDDGNRR